MRPCAPRSPALAPTFSPRLAGRAAGPSRRPRRPRPPACAGDRRAGLAREVEARRALAALPRLPGVGPLFIFANDSAPGICGAVAALACSRAVLPLATPLVGDSQVLAAAVAVGTLAAGAVPVYAAVEAAQRRLGAAWQGRGVALQAALDRLAAEAAGAAPRGRGDGDCDDGSCPIDPP